MLTLLIIGFMILKNMEYAWMVPQVELMRDAMQRSITMYCGMYQQV